MTESVRTSRLIEIYRRMKPEQRLQVSFDLSEIGRILLRLKVRHEYPEWEEEKISQEVRRRSLYNSEFDPGIERMCSRVCEELI